MVQYLEFHIGWKTLQIYGIDQKYTYTKMFKLKVQQKL